MGNRQVCKKESLKGHIEKQKRLLIWVLGGPCSGKTTQCRHLCKQFQLAHICPEAIIRDCIDEVNMKLPDARLERLHQHRIRLYNAIKVHERISQEEREFLGDLQHHESINQLFCSRRLSESENEDDDDDEIGEIGSKLVKKLRRCIREGKQIDATIITALMTDVMESCLRTCNGFVIDGYPRDLHQSAIFISKIGEPHLVFNFFCPEEVMRERLVKRAQLSQRLDENDFTIPFKFARFKKSTTPVIEQRRQEMEDGVKFLTVLADRSEDSIEYRLKDDVRRIFGQTFKFKRPKEGKKKEQDETSPGQTEEKSSKTTNTSSSTKQTQEKAKVN